MKRIFIVGFPRSGTTLLQALIGAHQDLVTFTESALFVHTLRPYRVYRPFHIRREPLLPRVEAFCMENNLHTMATADITHEVHRLDQSRWVRGLAIARVILKLLDYLTQMQNQAGWLEKTPRHLYYCDLITQAAPSTHFVHIARWGEDAVASHYLARPHWQGQVSSLSPRRTARLWNDELKRSLRYSGWPRHHFVTYEALTKYPQATLDHLVKVLELEPAPYLLERYRGVAKVISLPEETWKCSVDMPIETRSTFTKAFTPRERDQVTLTISAQLYHDFERLAGPYDI